jgi:hypothetical protein
VAFKAGYAVCARATATMLLTGAAASYASTKATELARHLGVSEDAIRIGADALQVVTMWKLAKAQRRGDVCFVAGTQVVVGFNADGTVITKAIEQIVEGDHVISRNQYDENDDPDPQSVTRVFRKTSDHVRSVTIEGDGGNVETIRTTDEHPFYVRGKGWTGAGSLTVGDQVQETDGTWQVVTASEREEHPAGIAVYNLQVEGDHTYFVEDGSGGADAVWVHNDCFRSGVIDKWSKKLGKRLSSTFEAHHIVPQSDPAASNLRSILQQLDIDINSSSNGVPLLPNYHRREIHFDTTAYVDAIEARIIPKISQGKAAVEAELEKIGEELFDNIFSIIE